MGRTSLLAALLGAACAVPIAQAGTVDVFFDNGTTNTTTALTGFGTTGAQMDGMRVTAYFSDGTSAAADWADTGVDSGGVSVGNRFSLNEAGTTFSNNFTLRNLSPTLSLTRVYIDAGPGDTVFDIDWPTPGSVSEGTPGSANGQRFVVTSANAWDIDATYIDRVSLGAAAPVGDLWRYLDITFTNVGGFAPGSVITYVTDTDNLLFAGDLTPVPLPPAVLGGAPLLGLALVWGSVNRRRTLNAY